MTFISASKLITSVSHGFRAVNMAKLRGILAPYSKRTDHIECTL